MPEDILNIISSIVPKENIKTKELLKKHTTFRIGGYADFFVSPENNGQLSKLVKALNDNNIKYYILGNGSNILAPDEGYEGVIIYIGENMSDIEVSGTKIVAGAGALLSRTAKEALKCSLAGMEFAAGIPGSIGGAVVMNAGAYGGEMRDIIVSATVCDRNGNIFILTNEELELSYRHSIIEEKEYIVLECEINLKKGKAEDIKAVMDDFSSRRREKQPLEYPSAGSTFKRPTGYFAGKLIEDAGLKGYTVGGAKVSEKHSGFVINTGNATAEDVRSLIKYVSEEVYRQFGVVIEPEVKIL
ncbi:MAG: UDP-N-acetylmuramate dehydrogenase [Lachnospiraceae bacterium]|nr:UDP-N-acetylmuramate dehydrogenase [Lachnospiraceae bacterium]MDE6699321.1 UDP-N-acetylmuramate dehydrogenase [Lachnospiraceae bacterium]